MAKYKLALKDSRPNDKSAPAKWYAIPSIVNRLDARAVSKAVTRNTTMSPIELETAFNLVCEGIIDRLQQGNSVQLGDLGILRLSFSSTGVENIEEFNAATMIKNLKVIFTPSKTLLEAVKSGVSFENVGVVEEGFTYPSVKAYQEYKVATRTENGSSSGSTDSGSSDSGDEEEVNPFG